MIFYIISLILSYTLVYVVGKTLYRENRYSETKERIKFAPIVWIFACVVLLIPVLNFLLAIFGWIALMAITLSDDGNITSSCWLFKK